MGKEARGSIHLWPVLVGIAPLIGHGLTNLNEIPLAPRVASGEARSRDVHGLLSSRP